MGDFHRDQFSQFAGNLRSTGAPAAAGGLCWLILTTNASAQTVDQTAQLTGALIAVGTALLGFIAAWVKQRTQRIRVEKRLQGPFLSELPREYEGKACRLLVLGDGGAGKTSLIRALTGNTIADPRIKTGDTQIYRMRFDSSDPPPAYTIQLEAIDYRGQNQGDIAMHLKNDAYDHVDAVVWVVDLFSPPEHDTVCQPKVDFDQDRIKAQIALWQSTVDIWRGLIGHKAKLWVLFINKADLAIGNSVEITNKAKEHYKPLKEALAARSADIFLKTIVGSANTGWGIPDLANLLFFKAAKTWHAAPQDELARR